MMFDRSASSANASEDPPPGLRWKYGPRTRVRFFCGIDIGQSVDPTAIVVLERRQLYTVNMHHSIEHRPHGPPEYLVVDAGRLPLGITYPAQAEAVAERLRQEPLAGNVEVYADRSGVGRAVVDELRRQRVPNLSGVTIVGGEGFNRDGLDYRVSKLALVTVVAARLNDETLRIAAEMPLATELTRELQDFQVNFTSTGAMTFAASGTGHDDLAIALSLALWGASGRPEQRMQLSALRGL